MDNEQAPSLHANIAIRPQSTGNQIYDIPPSYDVVTKPPPSYDVATRNQFIPGWVNCESNICWL